MGPPPKRQKISEPQPQQPQSSLSLSSEHKPQDPARPIEGSDMEAFSLTADDSQRDLKKEKQVGILHFVNASNPGFSGVLKQRYIPIAFLSPSADYFYISPCI
jgi:tRNA pseudouridine13 synthase